MSGLLIGLGIGVALGLGLAVLIAWLRGPDAPPPRDDFRDPF